ncbi:hypothetical protein FISHEDRAFT_35504 [Fistulina hepatica ATCC 64428]|uniref:uS12 prolyl 3,4-dihydroxylase n=1 Tax=Fistulina hepatica ATCC 64428 TaxID=1128425 RepID=A0A0D7AKA8_9AGAR|nr:hypothetical protein FISHEDRAFT_35504 [Fistulina hepatica ATCC 64428]
MAKTHDRSPSLERIAQDSHGPAGLIKRLKIARVSDDMSVTSVGHPDDDYTPYFASDLFGHNNIARLRSSYEASKPFHYAVVDKLFQDELLKNVKDECLSELNFTEKETDIYKVNQTGDLASLNYLTPEQIALLPNLLTLRNALYSKTFRSFLRTVTGCGPLSGTKQDMSVNSYTKGHSSGCHLLTHDDVIGSRRVSYILYMPLPHYQLWQKDWGGALELYPVKEAPDGQLEPESIPAKSIPPSWNQFIFFEVQPGFSFHSVEEVVVGGEGEDGRERLSISGWFHDAQEGEEGYVPKPPRDTKTQSSREQLVRTSTQTVFRSYADSFDPPLPDSALLPGHVSFLSEFLNPVYLQPRTMSALAARFVVESSLELHSFLAEPLAESLEARLRELDLRDGLGPDRAGTVPAHTCGTGDASGWKTRGPPHKWRYCTLKPLAPDAVAEAVTPRAASRSAEEIMRTLQDELFCSPAFRAWLAIVSRLCPMRHAVEARRFRPGLDYTLATSEEEEARLDVVLGLTPVVKDTDENGTMTSAEKSRGWQLAEWGGWECYMAPHNEEDDPAVYRASIHKKVKARPAMSGRAAESKIASTSAEQQRGEHSAPSAQNGTAPEVGEGAMDTSMGDEEEEEEDSTLLTVQPGYNRLLLVLRDERVMRFVKYVSAAAEGSRWDICGEYEVGLVQEDEDEDDEDE